MDTYIRLFLYFVLLIEIMMFYVLFKATYVHHSSQKTKQSKVIFGSTLLSGVLVVSATLFLETIVIFKKLLVSLFAKLE